MIRYQINGTDGSVAHVTDHCFRGLSMATPFYYMHQVDMYDKSGSSIGSVFIEDKDGRAQRDMTKPGSDELFDVIRSNIESVEYEVNTYRTEVVDMLKELVQQIPWMKDVTTVIDGSSITNFKVRGDIPGDQLFHVLSSLRNVDSYYWSTLVDFKKYYTTFQAFNMLMYTTKTTDWNGEVDYPGYTVGMDYMWANQYTVTKGSVLSVLKNGPRWFLEKGKLDYFYKELPFIPSVSVADSEYSENASVNLNCRMFRSFELPEDEDPNKEVFSSPLEIINFLKENF